jgi:hypothetical protein
MIKKIIAVVLLFTSVSLLAQRASSSPYSYFGIGDEFSNLTVEQSSMGGIGVAFSHYKYLNFTNPAAYSKLRYTTYAFGALNNDLTIKSGSTEQSSTSTSLSYVSLAFPIGTKAGFALGLQPVSAVGYSLSSSLFDNVGDIIPSDFTSYTGNGGVSRIYGSFGIQVYNGLSLGIEGDYSFGNVDNSIINKITEADLGTRYDEKTQIRGGSIKIGAQYEKELDNKLIVNAGATVKLENGLRVIGSDYLFSLDFISGASRDTLSTSRIDGKFNLPLKSTLGFGVGKFDKWYAGIEYENQDAFSTSGLLANINGAYRYGGSSRVSLGGFYLPKINSISSYWERVTYRAGFRYENTGLLVDGSGNNTNFTEINDFGISFGLGLPLKRLSSVNMGFEFGKRGTIENNLIEENYFNFRLSLSLTDTNWFIKRKID